MKNMNIKKIAIGAMHLTVGFGLAISSWHAVQAQEIAMPDALPDFVANGQDAPDAAVPKTNDKDAGSASNRETLSGTPQGGEPNVDRRQVGESTDKVAATTEIKINQPYSSKNLGQLLLPFMWEVDEDDEHKRLVATEVRTHAPAVLTIDFIDALPNNVSGEAYAHAIIASVAESLAISDPAQYEITTEEKNQPCEKKKNCPKTSIYRSTLEGSEDGVARRCAIDIVPNGQAILVLTLCAAQAVDYEPKLPEVVDGVLWGMQ